MRIGLFTEVYYPSVSGVVTSVTMLKRGLERQGHDVYVITTTYDNLHYKIEEDGHLIRLSGIKSGIYDFRITSPIHRRALNYIKSLNLDVIHSQTEFGVGLFAKIVAKKLDIPMIHTFHTLYNEDMYLNYVTKGVLPGLTKKALEKYIKVFCNKNVTSLIVPSSKTKKILEDDYNIKKEITVIPNGIELTGLYYQNYSLEDIKNLKKGLNINSDAFIVGYLGRIGHEKNIDFLIKNHAAIVSNNKNVKLLIVGGGPELDHLKSYVRDLNILDSVIFTDKVPLDQIGLYYQLMHVFVTASTSETQGLTTIEALASSIPAICANDDSFNSFIINGYNGYLFNNDDEYIKIINDIIKNKKILKTMKLNARQSVKPFSSESFVKSVLSVYEKVIKK